MIKRIEVKHRGGRVDTWELSGNTITETTSIPDDRGLDGTAVGLRSELEAKAVWEMLLEVFEARAVERLREQQQRIAILLEWAADEASRSPTTKDLGNWLAMSLDAMRHGDLVPIPPIALVDHELPLDPDDVVDEWMAACSGGSTP